MNVSRKKFAIIRTEYDIANLHKNSCLTLAGKQFQVLQKELHLPIISKKFKTSVGDRVGQTTFLVDIL